MESLGLSAEAHFSGQLRAQILGSIAERSIAWRGETPQEGIMESLSDAQIVEDLLAAVLSVNSYRLDKAVELIPAMRARGLTDPGKMSKADAGEITVLLNESGYTRGMLIGMMADRVKSLMIALHDGALTDIRAAVASKDAAQVTAVLVKINGIGKKVASNASMLLLANPSR